MEESKDDPEQPDHVGAQAHQQDLVHGDVSDNDQDILISYGRSCEEAIMELFVGTVVQEICNASGMNGMNGVVRRNRRYVMSACKELVKAEQASDRMRQRLLISKIMYRLIELFQHAKERMQMHGDVFVDDEELFPLLERYNNNMQEMYEDDN